MALSDPELDMLRDFLEDDPGDDAFVEVAAALAVRQRHGEAVEVLQAGLAVAPEREKAWILLAEASFTAGRFAVCVEALGRIPEARMCGEQAHLARARVVALERCGRAEEAATAADAYLALYPDDYEIQGVHERLRSWRHAAVAEVVLRGRDPFDTVERAEAYAMRGWRDRAARVFRRILLSNPNHPLIQRRLAELDAAPEVELPDDLSEEIPPLSEEGEAASNLRTWLPDVPRLTPAPYVRERAARAEELEDPDSVELGGDGDLGESERLEWGGIEDFGDADSVELGGVEDFGDADSVELGGVEDFGDADSVELGGVEDFGDADSVELGWDDAPTSGSAALTETIGDLVLRFDDEPGGGSLEWTDDDAPEKALAGALELADGDSWTEDWDVTDPVQVRPSLSQPSRPPAANRAPVNRAPAEPSAEERARAEARARAAEEVRRRQEARARAVEDARQRQLARRSGRADRSDLIDLGGAGPEQDTEIAAESAAPAEIRRMQLAARREEVIDLGDAGLDSDPTRRRRSLLGRQR